MTLIPSKSCRWSSILNLGVLFGSSLTLMIASCSELPVTPIRDSVTAKTANKPPVIKQPSSVTVNEGSVVYFDLKVTDPDNDIDDILYDLTNAPFGMQVTRVGGIYWETKKGDAGTYKVKVTADDQRGGIASVTFTVTVKKATNKPPVIKQPSSVTVKEGVAVYFDLSVTDPDNDIDDLLFSLSNAPKGMQVTRVGGIYWQTKKGDAGTYKVKVTANDQRGGTDSKTFTVKVVKK